MIRRLMGPTFKHVAKGVEKVKISKLFPMTESVIDRMIDR